MLATARANRVKLGRPTEMERVLALPRQDFSASAPGQHTLPEVTEQEDEDGTTRWLPTGRQLKVTDLQHKWTLHFRRHDLAPPLRHSQAMVLEEAYHQAQSPEPVGIIGSVGVGQGKTLAFWLCFEVFGLQRNVLLLPSEAREQYKLNLWEWQQHYRFTPPTVVYYSKLSHHKSTDLLRRLNPQIILADEVHCLRHPSSARTDRFLRYMRENPNTRFGGMSGTLTGGALSDYDHLCRLALRKGSPLPLNDDTTSLWGSVLNTDGEPSDGAWQALRPMCPEAYDRRDVRMMNRACSEHFAATPGVICTSDSSCASELVLTALYPEVTDVVRVALAELAKDWDLPDGSKAVDSLHLHRAGRQLSCGFFYVWDWPLDEDGEEIVDDDWLDARKEWGSWQRQYLSRNKEEGCDSEKLLKNTLRRQGWPAEGLEILKRWDVQNVKPEPPTRPIWIDPSPVIAAVKWAQAVEAKGEKAIIWFESRAVGEMLQAFGIPTMWAGLPNATSTPVVALSTQVYHKILNLQAWDNQLDMQPGSSGMRAEQKLGRTHRGGQMSPVVRATIFQHTWPLRNAFRKSVARAETIQDRTKQVQKLLLAKKEGFIGRHEDNEG